MDRWKTKKTETFSSKLKPSDLSNKKFFVNNNNYNDDEKDNSSLEIEDDYEDEDNHLNKPPQYHHNQQQINKQQTFNKKVLVSPFKSKEKTIGGGGISVDSFKWNEYEKQQKQASTFTIPPPNKFQEFKQKLSSPIKNNTTIVNTNQNSPTPNISTSKPSFKFYDSPNPLKGKLSFPKPNDTNNINNNITNTINNRGKKRVLDDQNKDFQDNYGLDDFGNYNDENNNKHLPNKIDIVETIDDDNNNNNGDRYIGNKSFSIAPTQLEIKIKSNTSNNTVKNNQGYQFIKRNDSFKDDQKYLGSLLRQSSQLSIVSDTGSQPSTQPTVNELPSTQSTMILSSQQQPQPIFNIIKSTSQLSISKLVEQQQILVPPIRSDTHDSIEDEDDEYIVKSHPIQFSPPPPQYNSTTPKKPSPNSFKFKYVKEEIDDGLSSSNGGSNLENLFSSSRRGIMKDDDIVVNADEENDENDYTPGGTRKKIIDVIVDDDDDNNNNDYGGYTDNEDNLISTNINNQTSMPKKSIKSKWLDDLSDSIISSTMNQTPLKTFKISKKKNIRGGLFERLIKLLGKEKFNYLTLTKRAPSSSISLQSLLNPLSNHFNNELHVKIVQNPNPLQPHVFVTQCICYNWPTSFDTPPQSDTQTNTTVDNSTTSIKLITIIFPSTTKTELKLDLNSNLIIDYWQKLFSNDDKITIYSHISRLNQNITSSNDNDNATIDQFNKELYSKIEINPISLIYKNRNLLQENSDESIIANLDITQLEDVNQNLIDINIKGIILQSFQRQDNKRKGSSFPTNKPISMLSIKDLKMKSNLNIDSGHDAVSIYVSTLNGYIAEIQVPLDFVDAWRALTENIFCDCLFADLQFIRNENLDNYSNFSSFIRHYIPNEFQHTQMNLTVFRVKPTSYYMVNTNVNPLFLESYQPLPIQTINETIINLISNRFEASQRISIRGEIVNIQTINKKTQSFILFLIDESSTSSNQDDNNNNEKLPINTISIQINSNPLHYNHGSFKVGDKLIIQLCIVQSPYYPISTILLVDEFSLLSIDDDIKDQDQTNENTSSNSNSNSNNSIGFSRYSLSTFSSNEFTTTTSNNEQQSLDNQQLNFNNIFSNYIFIDKFIGKVLEVETKNTIYRGCKICKNLVTKFENDLFQIHSSNSNEGFCQQCRILVDSELLIELFLIVQLNDGNDSIINLKISSGYCMDLLHFPLEYSLVDEYKNIIENLKSKSIEFHGLAVFNNSGSGDGTLYNINCLSLPKFN